MQHHQGRHSFGQPPLVMQQQGDTPVVVEAALLPRLTDANRNQPVQGEFMASSVSRFNDTGEQTVAEYAKYLVEVACPEMWLLLICRQANSNTGVVKLCYGAGYETTVVIGNANASDKPKKIAVGLSVNSKDATVEEIAGSWMAGAESIWNHVSSARSIIGGSVCVYIRSGNRSILVPPMLEEDRQSRRRTLRVWPDPDDENCVERMEELATTASPQVPPAAAAVAAAPTKPPAKKKKDKDNTSKGGVPPAAASVAPAPEKPSAKKSKSETKKRSSSVDEKADEANEPKKKRPKKDPTKPKRAATAYSLFMQDNRRRISEENPGLPFGKVSAILANEYKKLSAEELQAFQPRIDDDKKRHQAEMEVWKEKNAEKEAADDSSEAGNSDEGSSGEKPAAMPAPSTKKKAPKDPTKPHGKKNAYTFFMQENREKYEKANPDAKWPTIQKMLGEAYHALHGDEKEKYDAMAEEDKDRYSKEMETWIPGKDDDNHADSNEKKKRKKKDPNAPKKSKSAYILFSSDHRQAIKEANPDASFGEIGKLLGIAWKEASKEVREKYNGMADKEKERYAREKEVYTDTGKGQEESEKAVADDASNDPDNSDTDDGDKKLAAKPSKPAAAAKAPASTDSDNSDTDGGVKEPAAKPAAAAKAPTSPKAKTKAAKSSSKKSTPKKASTEESEATAPEEEVAEGSSKKRKHSEEVETAPVASSSTKKKKKKKKKRRSEPLTR